MLAQPHKIAHNGKRQVRRKLARSIKFTRVGHRLCEVLRFGLDPVFHILQRPWRERRERNRARFVVTRRIRVERATNQKRIDLFIDRHALARLKHTVIAQGFRQLFKSANRMKVVFGEPHHRPQREHFVIGIDWVLNISVIIKIDVANRSTAGVDFGHFIASS